MSSLCIKRLEDCNPNIEQQFLQLLLFLFYMLIEAFCLKGSPKAKYLPVPSSLANYHCQSPYFSIKSEYQKKRVWFFLLQNTVGIENVTLSRIALRYYRDSVTVILTAPSLQTYVMSGAVTEEIVTRSRRLMPSGRVQCFKMAKIDPVSPFYLTLWFKKETLQWGNLQEVRKTSL